MPLGDVVLQMERSGILIEFDLIFLESKFRRDSTGLIHLESGLKLGGDKSKLATELLRDPWHGDLDRSQS